MNQRQSSTTPVATSSTGVMRTHAPVRALAAAHGTADRGPAR